MLSRQRRTIVDCTLAMLATFATPVNAQIASVPEATTTLQGKVVETFGGPFVIETEQGRILVLARGFEGDVSPGDTLTINGRLKQRALEAETIRRKDTDLYRAPGRDNVAAPLPVGIAPTLARLGLTQLAPPERKKRHVEIASRDATGHNVVASFDLSGRILEIEDVDHDKKGTSVRLTNNAEAASAVKQAGLTPTGRIERKKHHFEVEATSMAGELIELQIDMSGYVFKKIWLN